MSLDKLELCSETTPYRVACSISNLMLTSGGIYHLEDQGSHSSGTERDNRVVICKVWLINLSLSRVSLCPGTRIGQFVPLQSGDTLTIFAGPCVGDADTGLTNPSAVSLDTPPRLVRDLSEKIVHPGRMGLRPHIAHSTHT